MDEILPPGTVGKDLGARNIGQFVLWGLPNITGRLWTVIGRVHTRIDMNTVIELASSTIRANIYLILNIIHGMHIGAREILSILRPTRNTFSRQSKTEHSIA